jgi:putative transcriptional regulator
MFVSLKNTFLIAMPALMDPHFSKTVTYLFEHTENGAAGIIINQPCSTLRLGELLEQIDLYTNYPEIAASLVFMGGPVCTDQTFILHDDKNTHCKNTVTINETIFLSTSSEILKTISNNKGPTNSLVALGCCTWGPMQLETELAQNYWLHGPANNDILFHMAVPSRWKVAAALIGVDVERLSDNVGHA